MKTITIESLSFNINGKKIIDNISLEFEPNKIHGIIGKNGAGKSSLIKCLAGINKFSGNINYGDKSLSALSPKELSQLFSYIPQAQDMQNPFTVKEILEFSRYPWSNKRKLNSEDLEKVNFAVKACEIEAFLDQNFSSLSGGEKQKVMIAAALAQSTPVILMDEITALLDPGQKEKIHALMKRLIDSHEKNIFWITHDIENVMGLADTISAIENGSLLFHLKQDSFSLEKLKSIF